MSRAALPVREAYRLWAPTYDAENVVTELEQRAVSALTPSLTGRALLDAACGTARRLVRYERAPAAKAVGVDLVPEMLRQCRSPDIRLVAGDVRALPLASAAFDVVWCRLALGHLPALGEAYRELARVARPGAHVIVSDFHPAAVRAGHVRSFRDAAGGVHAVEHHAHAMSAHVAAAAAAGLAMAVREDAVVDDSVRDYYVLAGRTAQYRQQVGLPLVLALAFRG